MFERLTVAGRPVPRRNGRAHERVRPGRTQFVFQKCFSVVIEGKCRRLDALFFGVVTLISPGICDGLYLLLRQLQVDGCGWKYLFGLHSIDNASGYASDDKAPDVVYFGQSRPRRRLVRLRCKRLQKRRQILARDSC